MNIDPSATQYDWPLYRAEHCASKPDRFADRPHYQFDLATTWQPMFLEGMWARCYGTSSNTREN